MSEAVLDVHDKNVRKSALLSEYQVDKLIPLMDVIRVLNSAKIRFVLAGAYGTAGWRKKARATEDVDVIVAARQIKKAVKALCEAFPELEPVDLPVVVRLRYRGTNDVAIDVMKPVQQPILEGFKHTHTVHSEGETYRVPSLEMALVMKFAAMISLHRADGDKHLDAHDFIYMVQQNPDDLNEGKLAALGRLLYADGGKDVVEMARKARQGEKLIL